MDRVRLYLFFGITSALLQAWAYARLHAGEGVPRLSFLLGPFGLYFLVMGLHPDLRKPADARTPAQQRLMFGVLTACAILAWWNYRFMRGGS